MGDIFYIRSDDNGTTWSAPIVLNSDAAEGGNKAQWMPSVSVTPEGNVVVSWYDRRNTTDGTNYERWGIQSPDNGLSFGQDERYSDTLIQQPEQPDSAMVACYAGDYDYSTAINSKSFVTWTDGRNQVSGHNQQDVYFGAVEQGPPTGGVLEGTVTDGASDAPIAGARVHAVGPVDRTVSTNNAGFYRFRLPEGSYDMTVTAFAYLPGSASGVPVVEGQTTTQDFALALGPANSVSGTVTSSSTGLPIANAQVRVLNTPIPPAMTDVNGMYAIPSVPVGTYDLQASAGGYAARTVQIVVDQDLVVDFGLDPVAGPCNPGNSLNDPSACDAIPGNLVANCGMETGNYPPWVRSGDPSFTSIDNASAHSGVFGLDIGPVNGLGFIAQNLATKAGGNYALRFWLKNLGGNPNRIQVSWGGTVILDRSDLPAFNYTEYCWNGTAATDSTELKFGYLQVPSFFYHDDVSVVAQ